MKGLFVTFEGIDGSGKSTQIEALAKLLTERGFSVLTTREPGGTESAEAIRKTLLTAKPGSFLPVTELMLILAARYEHAELVIRPALRDGTIVICDRFIDSTFVYQVYAGGVHEELFQEMHQLLLPELTPDLTVMLDIPETDSAKRIRERLRDKDYFENRPDEFHQKLRKGFQVCAELNANRCIVYDGRLPAPNLTESIADAVIKAFEGNAESE